MNKQSLPTTYLLTVTLLLQSLKTPYFLDTWGQHHLAASFLNDFTRGENIVFLKNSIYYSGKKNKIKFSMSCNLVCFNRNQIRCRNVYYKLLIIGLLRYLSWEVPANKPENLGSIIEIHVMEGKQQLLQIVLWSHRLFSGPTGQHVTPIYKHITFKSKNIYALHVIHL